MIPAQEEVALVLGLKLLTFLNVQKLRFNHLYYHSVGHEKVQKDDHRLGDMDRQPPER